MIRKHLPPKKHFLEFVRFLLIGGTCTLITYLIYLALLSIFNYQFAYTLAYIIGIVLSYLLNSLITFKQKASLKRFLAYPLVYVLQYGLNMVLLSVLVTKLHQNKTVAPLIAIAISLPFTFILSRLIIVSNPKKPI